LSRCRRGRRRNPPIRAADYADANPPYDRWVRLGAPTAAQPLPSNDVVMRCAMAALDGRDCAAEIGAQVRALAERSRDMGFDAAAYLLDLAAFELNAARPSGKASAVTPPAAGSP